MRRLPHGPRSPRTTSAHATSTARGAARSTTTSSSAPTPAWRPSSATRTSSRPTRSTSRTRRSASTSSPSAKGAAIDGELARPAPARGPHARSRDSRTWSRSSSGRSASATRSRQGTADSNEIWVELIAKAGDRVDRPLGRDRRRRQGRPVRPLHQRLHARPRRQPDRPPQPAGHLRPALQQADPARGGAGRPLRARRPRGHRRADHARGEGQLPQVRPQVHRQHLRQGEGARAAGRRHGQRPRPLPVRGGPKASNEPSPIPEADPGSAGTTTASACCSKGATRGARRAS